MNDETVAIFTRHLKMDDIAINYQIDFLLRIYRGYIN